MQLSIRHALLLSLLALGSCGQEPADPSPADPGAPVSVDTLFRERRFEELVELLGAQETLDAQETLRLAQAYVGLNEVPKAVGVARAGMQQHPQFHPLAMLLTEVYAQLGQHKLAVETLRTARENGCPDEDTALFLGVCLGRMVDLDGARAEFERAQAAGIAESEIHYNLAVLLHEQAQIEEAEELLRGVVESTPEHPFAQRELARVLLTDATEIDARVEEAEALLNTCLDEDPEDWRAYELFGDVTMLREDYDAAVAYYTEALRFGLNPKHVEDKYRAAEMARKAWLIEQGVVTPSNPGQGKGLPIKVKDSMEQIQFQAEQNASDPDDGSN